MITHDWHEKIILIVEDEHINFRYLQEILKKTQAQILRAENGLEAIETAKEKNVDLILMDIKLPVMDGYEATRKIREFNKDIPIIAQTAYVMSGEEEKTRAAGCDDYLTKPLRIKTVLETLSKYLEK
ncbi:response regulator [Salinivirga cyanobacteriivorans]|uniref:Polar-differentiation response regulator DivK n=1 Tax=Salinivirga cyanobacteriivorans TaxID=1307839 RepID=A0A0S2I2Y9_9BACT|nr:response regulator [Salinivirga cyanobacteriivorans]ALO16710.1 Polar-differentiation response regulator DivK [Salinivirga cyanobacteriivorans]